MHAARAADSGRLRRAWAAVILANLPVPLLFALGPTEQAGRLGMAVAVGLFWLLGDLICIYFRGLGRALVVGGVLVGLLQFVPIAQLVAGIFGLGLAAGLGHAEGDLPSYRIRSEWGGFLATLVSGGLLSFAAGLIGGVLEPAVPSRWWHRRGAINT